MTHVAWPSFSPLPTSTLNERFGMNLWPHFSNAFRFFAGYPADQFKFTTGKTPMSTYWETSIFVVLYYTVIFGGRELMRNRSPLKLRTPFLVHNFGLTAISAVLLALFLEELVPTIVNKGLFFAVCDRNGGWTQHLEVLYYVNYLTKYLELVDTVFLCLKKKPLTFLHCYHHGATAVLCFIQLGGTTPVSWVCITLNLAVHVVMYYYYYQSARGVRIWWKAWITRLQIVQFIVDLVFIYYASYMYLTSTYAPWMPLSVTCGGDDAAVLSGIFVLTSYLGLFIMFYSTTYRQSTRTLASKEVPLMEHSKVSTLR